MTETRFDVLAIGNAMVDILAHTTDAEVERLGMVKGAMTLIDADRAAAIYTQMPPAVEASGGSAANTAVGVASLGARAAYIGVVGRDQLGDVFRHDIRSAGVAYDVPPVADMATGRCMILITPDAHRTMNTFLGAGAELGPEDVDEAVVADSAITYLEGYLWDPPRAKEAFLLAMKTAHGAGRRVALTLSDPFCVERHRAEFRDLVAQHVDVLFANELELLSLYETSDFEEAVRRVQRDCAIAAVTRSEHGSVAVSTDRIVRVPAERIDGVVDTTGAGDLYAAGFLVGLTRGLDLGTCARMGGIAAAEVISHVGPRPERPLAELVAALTAP